MIALLGFAGVVTALGASAVLAFRGIQVARGERHQLTLRGPSLAVLIGAAVAFLALEAAILAHDFTIEYVARNTATTTPFVFLLASGWAALEGSIVLWGLVLAVFTYLLVRKIEPADGLGAGAMAVMGIVGVFWFGIMATVADPFSLCTEVVGGVCSGSSWLPLGAAIAPTDGLGPNPLLQNHILMAVHPPLLYVGYVGFTVPFAFAISALVRGEQGRAWLDRTHRWSLVAWSFLTAGILMGAWWSYEVLGWGGYWAWDPVENAAFLPWLVGTAFIHSAIVQRRRGMLQAWNFMLVIATFSLTILGTFLTRSGVIASVHSFTQSPIGPALLGFLLITILVSLGIFASRVHLVASSPRLESLASREGAFLLNNLLLTLFAFTVLIGTTYPLLIEAFQGRQVSVGRPFFDRVTLPIAFALLLAMGVGPIVPYRVARASVVWERVRVPLQVAPVAGAIAVLLGVRSVPTVGILVLASFIIAVITRLFVTQYRKVRDTKSPRDAALSVVLRDPGFWGGQISHIGLALVAVGIAVTTALAVRTEVRLSPGEVVPAAGYCVEYQGPFVRNEPQRTVEGAAVALYRSDCTTLVSIEEPRLNRYPNSPQAVATPSVHTGLFEDVYVTLAGGSADEAVVGIFVFPFMWLLWLGGLVTIGGGVFALVSRRRIGETRPAQPEKRTQEAV